MTKTQGMYHKNVSNVYFISFDKALIGSLGIVSRQIRSVTKYHLQFHRDVSQDQSTSIERQNPQSLRAVLLVEDIPRTIPLCASDTEKPDGMMWNTSWNASLGLICATSLEPVLNWSPQFS